VFETSDKLKINWFKRLDPPISKDEWLS